MRLPGVGRKTASVILANAFGKLAMPVDTHVFRVSNRLGPPGKGQDAQRSGGGLKRLLPEQGVESSPSPADSAWESRLQGAKPPMSNLPAERLMYQLPDTG